jgi:hypothetical protein
MGTSEAGNKRPASVKLETGPAEESRRLVSFRLWGCGGGRENDEARAMAGFKE